MKRSIVLLACVVLLANLAASLASAKSARGRFADYKFMEMPAEPSIPPEIGGSMFQAAAATTTVLGWWQFDTNGLPDPQGWTAHDMTVQLATYFHVAGSVEGCDPITPIAGTKSMWCGRWSTNGDPWCGWVSLPGYGNDWEQSLEAQNVSTLSYSIAWECETGYDYAYLEWWDQSGHWWNKDTTVNAGQGSYTGTGSRSESVTSPFGSTKVRIHFESDAAASDEDGLTPTAEGAVKIDNLSVNGGPVEDWENEACGALQSTDGKWAATILPGYDLYAKLVHGASLVQEDPCFKQRSYLWAFFDNPAVTNYACGGWPLQGAMPYGPDENGLYMNNEIWSPWIPISGSGTSFLLQFLTYRDLPLDNMQFYVWSVRTRNTMTGGCPTTWRDNNAVYYGGNKDWIRQQIEIGPYMNAGDNEMQVALGAVDLCNVFYCWDECHSHAPLFDQVRVVRVGVVGPQWSVRDYNCWQDNFPEEGGVGPTDYTRCDMAQDVLISTNPGILPGDSMVVVVTDPVGLAADNTSGRARNAVYAFVRVADRFGAPITGKNGLAMQSPDNKAYAADPLAGNVRWPFVAGLAPTGWDAYRFDYTVSKTGSRVSNSFCCDLMDLGSGPTGPHYKHANENVAANTGIFAPGDVINYILAAKNTADQWSYMYRTYNGQGSWARTSNLAEALASPCEWSVLPDAGRNVGDLGDILYVDDADDRGGPAQLYFDWAFRMLLLTDKVDRFDVLGPSTGAGNSLASRVKNIQNQIIGDPIEVYQVVIWNCSNLSTALMGDGGVAHGGSSMEKSDDFSLAYTFLDENPDNPGWAYWGDNVVQDWSTLTGTGAVNLKSIYMHHVLVNRDQSAITGIISPKVYPVANTPWLPETFYAYGGCPGINDFDSVNKEWIVAHVSHLYNNDPSAPAAVFQTTANAAGSSGRFHLAGFAFDSIRDDDAVLPLDRAKYLRRLFGYFETSGGMPGDPVGIDPAAFTNNLEGNYPNPFNPTTTIKYSIASSGHVSLKIYNAAGQLVRTLVNEEQAPRADGFAVTWDGTGNEGQSVASGVYFYQLTAKNFEQTKKMVLLK